MTVSLAYDSTLSRVRITATGIDDATEALVEWSTDQIRWLTVRGGAATDPAVLLDDYEFAPNVVNYYRVTPTPAGLHLTGNSGSTASTPNAAALQITGDVCLIADATVDAWVSGTPSGANDYFGGKYNSATDNRSYAMRLDSTGQLQFLWSTAGTVAITRTATAMPVPIAGRLAVAATLDVDNGAGGHTVTFYTAPTAAGPWTQLGAPVITAGATSVFNSGVNADLIVGAIDAGAAGLMPGVIHSFQVRSGGLAGTVVADAVFTDQPHGSTGFTDSAGRVWTVNGDATIINTQSADITPTLTDVWLKSVARPFLNQVVTLVGPGLQVERFPRGGVFDIVGRSLPVAVSDVRGSRRYALTFMTETDDAADDLERIFAAGDTLFLHAPAGFAIPASGVYVQAGQVFYRYPNNADPLRLTTVQFVEVAAPGADVVGSTSTWQTVINNYATWQDLIADKATWADVLELIGDPSEVIVP